MKSKSVVLMVVSLGFGLIAAIGISQVMGNNSQAEPAIKRAQVLVAAVNLKHGDDLTEESVKIEHWPADVIPETAARDFQQIKFKKITTRLSKSLPILLSDIASPEEIGRINIPKGYKLVAIKVSAEETFSGLLQPGDRVDVIGVVNVRDQDPGTANKTMTVSKTFLKNIEVYSVDGKLHSGGPREGSAGNAIVGVLVTEKQSEMIVLVQKVAKLRLVLRGDHEEEADGEEFTDYSGFYESVFGKDDEQDLDQVEKPDNELHHTMKMYEGDQYSEVEFRGSQRVKQEQQPPFQGDFNDSADYGTFEENYNDLEEDQYPGQ